MPHLSLVVVNWNTRELLLDLLGALRLEHAPFETELIVVDNASDDGSVEAVRGRFGDVALLPQERNGGFAFGVNRGLERATGKWILLLNTDARADWSQIEALVRAADREPDEASVFGPAITDEHGRPQPSTWRRHEPGRALAEALFLDRLAAPTPPTTASDVDCVSGCVFLIRAAVLPLVGGFDERFFMYFEEADFCERVRAAGHRVRFLPEITFVHEGGLSAERAASRTFLAFRESRLLYHAAWHGRLATEFVRICLLIGSMLRVGLLLVLLLPRWKRRRSTLQKIRLHLQAIGLLARPGLVGDLHRRPREVTRTVST